MDYYDIHLNADAEVTLTMEEDDSVMVFTLLGDVYIDGEHIRGKKQPSNLNGRKTVLQLRTGMRRLKFYI